MSAIVVLLFQERSRGTLDGNTTPPESVHASLTCEFDPRAERGGGEGVSALGSARSTGGGAPPGASDPAARPT